MIFTEDASVNIMFQGLINPCIHLGVIVIIMDGIIHLIESHQLYNVKGEIVGPYELQQTGGDTRCEYALYYIFPDLDF